MLGKWFLFVIFIFGCISCGKVENVWEYEGDLIGMVKVDYSYLKFGFQMGWKRFKKYWDDMNYVFIQIVKDVYVDVVYGVEE